MYVGFTRDQVKSITESLSRFISRCEPCEGHSMRVTEFLFKQFWVQDILLIGDLTKRLMVQLPLG